MPDESDLKSKIAETVTKLYGMGFVLEHEGNVSARSERENRFVITPSQLARHLITSKDILVVDGEGEVIEGDLNPSVETGMHLKIYSKRQDVGAVVHFHSLHATTLACLHATIPPFLDEIIPFLGEDVPTADYSMPGTEELASSVASTLSTRNAVLLANHGAIVCGRDLNDAFEKAELLEKASTIYLTARSVGEPKRLPDSAIETYRELFQAMLG